MKKLACLLFILSCSTILIAQKNKKTNPDLPAFGTVEKSDLELKNCDFDDKAEAMILVDEGTLEFVLGSGLELKKRIRIKILNDKGLEWANVHLPYRSAAGDQNIISLEAQTYNLDDK